MILKKVLTDICINIWKQIILYINTFFSSIADVKCTPSDRQMYPRFRPLT